MLDGYWSELNRTQEAFVTVCSSWMFWNQVLWFALGMEVLGGIAAVEIGQRKPGAPGKSYWHE